MAVVTVYGRVAIPLWFLLQEPYVTPEIFRCYLADILVISNVMTETSN